MGVRIIQAHELDQGLISTWRHIQSSNENLRSPYYCPEYSQAVHSGLQVGDENGVSAVEIAIIESQETKKIEGFFPFQRGRWGRIYPVGKYLSDYQGVICRRDFSEINSHELLRKIGATYFYFNHLPLNSAIFSVDSKINHHSPIIDVNGGYDAYLERWKTRRNFAPSGIYPEVRRKTRKIINDLGPLSFKKYEKDSNVLRVLMKLKISQWKMGRAPHRPTAFETPWVIHFFDLLFEQSKRVFFEDAMTDSQSNPFGCVLSTLHAGETLLAIQLNLRHARTLHGWFFVYDPKYSAYSPGILMLMQVIQNFAEDDVGIIDMGRGATPYKMRVCTDLVPLGEGASSNPPILAKSVLGARLAVREARRQFQQLRGITSPSPQCH